MVFLSLGFLLYSNVLNGKFIFDDNTFIENNQFVKSGNLRAIFSSGITQGSGLNDNFYRPLQQTLYVLSYKIAGSQTWAFHMWNVIFHSFNGFLLFVLLGLLFPQLTGVNFAVSILFLFHPLQTQAISYISGLSEPLSAFFVLLSLVAFAGIFDTKAILSRVFLVVVFVIGAVLALLSKENGVIVGPICFLILGLKWKERSPIGTLHRVLPILALGLGLGFVYLKMTVLNFTGSFGLSNQENIYNESLSVRIITFLHVFPEYLKMFFAPFHLHYETPYTAYTDFSRPQSVLSILIIGTWSGWSIWKARSGVYIPLFSFFWFFITIAPVSGLIPLNSMYLEHWLYLPQIGLCFLLVYGIQVLIGKFTWAPIALVPVLFLYSVQVFARNKEWSDPEKFYRNEIKYTKKSARMYNNLAMVLADKKDCQSAISYYQKAIELYDVYPQTHHNLARCLEDLGYLTQAADEYFRALMIDPNFIYSHAKLPGLLLKLNDQTRAENFLKLQIKLDKGIPLTQRDILEAGQVAQP